MKNNIWETLSQIDCSKHTEKKGNLTYLSWAWAWGTLMKHYPTARYQFTDHRDHNVILLIYKYMLMDLRL